MEGTTAEEAAMAKIGNDRMIVRGEQRSDDSWLFTICYTAIFADADLGQRFDDSVQIREIHCPDRPQRAYECPVSFRATGHRVFRKKRIVVRGEDYDADAGLDTVCAWIRLHRCEGADRIDDEQHTPALVPCGGRAHNAIRRRAAAQSLRC
jgi:hypothetical protein